MTLLSRFRWWRRLHNCEQAIITLEARCRELEHLSDMGSSVFVPGKGWHDYDPDTRKYLPRKEKPP